MKPVFAALLLAAIVMACNSPEKKETVSMTGAFKMLSQNVKSDSIGHYLCFPATNENFYRRSYDVCECQFARFY